MALSLGSAPQGLTVTLVRHADFISSIRRKDGTPWPADTSLILEFTVSDGKVEWPAELTSSTATWNYDQDVVDELIARRIKGVRLWYVEAEVRLLWAFGDADLRGV